MRNSRGIQSTALQIYVVIAFRVCVPVILSRVVDLFCRVLGFGKSLVDGFGRDFGLGQCVDQLFVVQNVTCVLYQRVARDHLRVYRQLVELSHHDERSRRIIGRSFSSLQNTSTAYRAFKTKASIGKHIPAPFQPRYVGGTTTPLSSSFSDNTTI